MAKYPGGILLRLQPPELEAAQSQGQSGVSWAGFVSSSPLLSMAVFLCVPQFPHCKQGANPQHPVSNVAVSPLSALPNGFLKSDTSPFHLPGAEAPDGGDTEHSALSPRHHGCHPAPRLQVPAGLLR